MYTLYAISLVDDSCQLGDGVRAIPTMLRILLAGYEVPGCSIADVLRWGLCVAGYRGIGRSYRLRTTGESGIRRS